MNNPNLDNLFSFSPFTLFHYFTIFSLTIHPPVTTLTTHHHNTNLHLHEAPQLNMNHNY